MNENHEVVMKCEQDGCDREGFACFIHAWEKEPNGVFCYEHAPQQGFCRVCGMFWGGIESFDFLHPGICDHCYDELEQDDSEYDELDEDYGEDYDA